jgi:hypothetical protein
MYFFKAQGFLLFDKSVVAEGITIDTSQIASVGNRNSEVIHVHPVRKESRFSNGVHPVVLRQG